MVSPADRGTARGHRARGGGSGQAKRVTEPQDTALPPEPEQTAVPVHGGDLSVLR